MYISNPLEHQKVLECIKMCPVYAQDCYFNLHSRAWNKATCIGVSPRKAGSVWVVPQQLTATQDTVTCYIINQQ